MVYSKGIPNLTEITNKTNSADPSWRYAVAISTNKYSVAFTDKTHPPSILPNNDYLAGKTQYPVSIPTTQDPFAFPDKTAPSILLKDILIPPEQKIAGKTQAELGNQWWQYAVSIPTNPDPSVRKQNPFTFKDETDPRGKRGSIEKALIDQYGPVFFLGGSFFDPEQTDPTNPNDFLAKATRTIIVPKKFKFIFFPLLNGSNNNVVPPNNDGTPSEGGGLTVKELREELNNVLDPKFDVLKSLKLVINEQSIPFDDLLAHRQRLAEPFSYTVRDLDMGNNILDFTGDYFFKNPGGGSYCPTLSDLKGEVSPVVSDGYWTALPSLFPGKILKTINFGGTLEFPNEPHEPHEPPSTTFELDITYNILNEVKGTDYDDRLFGTPGDDYIDGGEGNDILIGKAGDDVIVGGNGDDIIYGGSGDDELWGEGGVDRFVFKPGDGMDTIFDLNLQNGEKIDLSAFGFTSTDDVLKLISNFTTESGSFTGSQIDFQDTFPWVDDKVILKKITSTEITGNAFII